MSLCTLAAVMVTATSLSACSKKSDDKSSGGKITLSFLDWESADMNKLMMNAIKDFEKDNSGVKVKQIPTPVGDYYQKLNTMIASGNAPDIFQGGYDGILKMAAKNQTYDFSKQAKADSDLTKGFYPGVYDLWVQDGKTIGLPGLVNVYGVFYNKDLFKKAGLTDPKVGWTWDEMFQDAQKLASNKGGVKNYGMYGLTMDQFNVSVMSVSNGGQPYSDGIQKTTKVTADETFKNTIKNLQGYIKSGAVTPPSYKTDNMASAFEQGKIPMMWYGQWEADTLIRNDKDLNWGFAPTPKGSVKQSVIYDNVGWASPKGIKNPDKVWALMKFMDTKMYEKVLPDTPVAPTAYKASAQPYFDKLKAAGHQDLVDSIDYMMKTEDKQPVRFNQKWSDDAGKYATKWNDVLEGKQDMPYALAHPIDHHIISSLKLLLVQSEPYCFTIPS